MPTLNGNMKWIVPTLITILFGAGFTIDKILVSNVIANDKKNTEEHTEIRRELNNEIKEIREEQKIAYGQRKKILAILEGMKNN